LTALEELREAPVHVTCASSRPRRDLQTLAEDTGLVVQTTVTKALDMFVADDAASQPGKATKARSYGTHIMSDEAFLRRIGVTTS